MVELPGPMAAVAYCGPPPAPDVWLLRWNADPVLLLGLLALGVIMLRWAEDERQHRASGATIVVLLLAFVSPICALSSALFSARIAHHLLLVLVAAPLLALALPRWRAPPLWLAAILHAAVFWLWHAPLPYAWALGSDAAYWLMELSLIGTAVSFWAAVVRHGRGEPASAVITLMAVMAQMGLLGALLTFAGRPLYAAHFLTTAAWGLTPLEDQQLAGLLMWVPGSLPYLGAAVLLGAGWLVPRARADRWRG